MSTIAYWICTPFAWLVRLFYSLTGSYGVSLILFTLVIKLILLPFQMKSKKSMVRMNRMSGKMQEIQKKYANNRVKMNEEMQKFYEEEGVNPMSGCLWSFLPLPILMALYYIIREPIVYFMNFGGRAAGLEVVEAARQVIENAGITLTSNAAYEQIEISQIINSQFPDFIAQHSGWVNVNYTFLGVNLNSIPTSSIGMLKEGITWGTVGLLLIPIISAAMQLLVMKISMKGQANSSAAATNKSMLLMMPLFSLWIGFSMPAAISIYWIAQAVFGTVQDVVLTKHYRKVYDAEDAVRQEKAALRRAEEAEKERQRQLRREQNPDGILADNVSKKKLRQQEKEAAEKAARDYAAKKNPELEKEDKKPLSGIAERPYCRGRAYQADHYGKRGAQKEASSGENEE